MTRTTTFTRRTGAIYRHQRKLAARMGQALDYSCEQFRRQVEAALLAKRCRYCNQPISETNFSADHATPTSRQGSFCLWNIRVCCSRCNKAKADLSAEEWGRLLECVSGFHPTAQTSVWRRLLLGGQVFSQARKKKAPGE